MSKIVLRFGRLLKIQKNAYSSSSKMRGLYLNFGQMNADLELEDSFIVTSKTNEKIYVFVDGDLMKVKVRKALKSETNVDVQTWYDLRTDVDELKEKMNKIEPSVTDLEQHAIKKVTDLTKNGNYFWKDKSGNFTDMLIPIGSKTIYDHPRSQENKDNQLVIGYDSSMNILNTVIKAPIIITSHITDVGYKPILSDENKRGVVNFENFSARGRYYKNKDGEIIDIWSYTIKDKDERTINDYPIGDSAYFSDVHVMTNYYLESPDGNIKRRKKKEDKK